MRKLHTYICLFLLLSNRIASATPSNGDSLKRYTITDPRNPDCLCHTYQKAAEKEYKKKLKEKSLQQFDKTISAKPQKAQRKLLLKSSKKKKKQRRPKQKQSFLDACFKW